METKQVLNKGNLAMAEQKNDSIPLTAQEVHPLAVGVSAPMACQLLFYYQFRNGSKVSAWAQSSSTFKSDPMTNSKEEDI